MAKFRQKQVASIEAVRWVPDSNFGSFDAAGRYWNKRPGVDPLGVQYTVTEVGLPTPCGFMRIRKGDWIITGWDRIVLRAEMFEALFELDHAYAQPIYHQPPRSREYERGFQDGVKAVRNPSMN